MAQSLDRFQPTLYEFPIQNNRTGWHPVWTPTLLVVPWSYDVNGRRIDGSRINSITFAIEKPRQISVAGHPQNYDPLGPKPEASPDVILFEITLTYDQLIQHKIELSDVKFYDQQNNITDDPIEGDNIQFINSRGIQGQVEYLPDAEYFDLSSIEINVDNLPSGRYVASWTVNYFRRIDQDNQVLYCIDKEQEQKSKLDYKINHPGEIHEEMVKRTPALYMENIDRKQDFTVNLYRPFADILQDHFDEGELFYGINWIRKIPPQLFPYLSYLIGIELPTQSNIQSIDKIRRRMLERGVELQRLKGSELAVKELFSILGFVVEIVNLWVDTEGDRFFAPNELDPEPRIFPRDEIISTPVSQTDPLVAKYSESGFGNFEIPLLYHNIHGEIVINAFIVKSDSDADNDLQGVINNLLEDPNYLTKDTIINGPDGYLMLPSEISSISKSGLESSSRLVVSDIEVLAQSHTGLPVIRFDGVKYDILRDRLRINFADYKDLSKSTAYIFATYVRNKIEVPEHLKNNQTNRFDVKITSKTGEIEPSLYDYLIDSLFKFKAFHSLLRKISYDADLRDFYNVTDFCANSYLSQQQDSNGLMIPPACPPDVCYISNECTEQNARGGLREIDSAVRGIILEGLKEEYDRWHDVTKEWLTIAEEKRNEIEWAKNYSNINIPIPNGEGDNYGQDRVSHDFVVEVIGNTNYDIGDRFDVVYMGTYLETVNSTDLIRFNIQTTRYQILSDLVGVGVSIELVRKIDTNIFYVSMIIDVDQEPDIRSKIAELDRISTPDYCYKSRVKDLLTFKTNIPLKTVVRNRPCNLMQGLGVYYYLEHGSLNNVRGWYNDLLQKSDQNLHYSNDLFFENFYHGSHQRPSIDIEKIGFGFPGHRQIRGGLLEDFTHPTHKARPWDISDKCFELLNPLNARIIKITEVDGTINESLVFDEEDLFYEADHTRPDITTYSGQSNNEFTHAIFSTTENRPAIYLDNTIYTSDSEIESDSPVFETARKCDTGGYLDYRDGYAASVGELSFNNDDIWASRGAIESDLESTATTTAVATYSSEILIEKSPESDTIQTYDEYSVWKGYRYDCDCLDYLCINDQRNCNHFFKDRNDQYDFNNDHLEIDYVASLKERMSGECYQYSGEITDWLNWDFDTSESNEVRFKDDYGIQYYIIFEENAETLDITYETFQPRIWGKESDGYIENGKVFRNGIITTIRQVFMLQNGQWVLNAEGTNQEIGYRQTNYDCDIPTPENKFNYLHEYATCDEAEMRVICGPHWTDPDDDNDTSSIWIGKEDISEWSEVWDEVGGIWDVGLWDFSGYGTGLTEGSCQLSGFTFIDVWGTN